MDPILLNTYLHLDYKDVHFMYLKRAFEYYVAEFGKDFESERYYDYLELIAEGIPPECAASECRIRLYSDDEIMEALYEAMFSDPEIDKIESERYEYLRRLEEEEESWYGVNITPEYDEDNPCYDNGYDDGWWN